MIREINRKIETNWYEKIQLEMDLQDLQLLYDCIGAVPSRYFEEKHKHTSFNYIDDIAIDLYEGLNKLLLEHNGITDDNKMVNLNVELEIKDDE